VGALPYDDDLTALRSLVDRQVISLIQWYQRKKRWPRRLHKLTTTAVITLGALIPLASAWSSTAGTRIFVSIIGVLITTLASLAASYNWQERWRLFTLAQNALESALADWEFTITKAQLSGSPGQARTELIAATEKLLETVNQAREEETKSFFSSVLARPGPKPAA
jgi:Protein of unknown function (DUF4231)